MPFEYIHYCFCFITKIARWPIIRTSFKFQFLIVQVIFLQTTRQLMLIITALSEEVVDN